MTAFRTTILLLASAVMSMLAAPSYAAVLAQYDFQNTRSSTDSDLNSAASTFDNGPGFNTSSYYTSSPSSGGNRSLPTVSTITDGTNEAGAVSNNDYYTFTLTPNAGYSASLTDLTFKLAVYGTGSTANFAVYSSVNSFSSNIGTATTSNTTSFDTATISLAAPQFQNLTSAVTFRIYIWDNQNDSTKGDLLDNVILNGNLAAVPEPSTWAMMGLGAGLLGAAQRFRRKRR